MRDYLRTVAAYLTGWVIAQNLYRLATAHERDQVKVEIAEYVARQLKVELRNDGYLSTQEADEVKAAHNLQADDAAHKAFVAMRASIDPSGLMDGPLTITEPMLAAGLYTAFVESAMEAVDEH